MFCAANDDRPDAQTAGNSTTGYNVGVGGSTCAQWVDVVDGMLEKFEPSNAVLHCGQNDLLLGGGCGLFTVKGSTVDETYDSANQV